LDFPALDWPIASFPRYKYPLEEFTEENKAEDRKCLAEVEEEFERFNKSGRFVAGVIIEPVQAEGGDVHASPEFFQELQRITKKVPGVYRFVPKNWNCQFNSVITEWSSSHHRRGPNRWWSYWQVLVS
jgi:hypothetical protein